MPRNMYANFFPINAVSGSSFTLIKDKKYLGQNSIIYETSLISKKTKKTKKEPKLKKFGSLSKI